MQNTISIRGAKEHNLKNIDLEIPKNKLVVFTGVSGSGKSSLAFDTIYAEGQRRYVESLSSYARQFLGLMSKPDVEFIEGLSPSISIDQKSVSHNPRSTVGTITEIYDYLRLLYARIGHPFCPNDGTEIKKMTVDEIVNKMIALVEKNLQKNKMKPHQFTVISPVVRDRKGEFSGLFENLRAKGFTQLIIDAKKHILGGEDLVLIKTNKHTVEVIIDTFSLDYKNWKNEELKTNFRSRLFAAVEQAIKLSDGLVILQFSQEDSHLFSEKFSCPVCGFSLAEIEPRMFSFNSPIGACPQCKGLGFIYTFDPDLVLNKNLSISEGGIMPFSKMFFHMTWYARLLKTVFEDIGIDERKPIAGIDEKKLNLLLYGNDKTYRVRGYNRFGRETTIFEKFIGVIPELEKKYAESESDSARWEIEKFMNEETCKECAGKRLKPEVLSIKIENQNIADLSDQAIDKMELFFVHLENKLTPYEKEVTAPILNEIKNRLGFLHSVGLSYLTINRPGRTLSGGEAQRIRLASQIGSGLTGVIYVLDEPSIGLHPKDVHALVNTLKKLRDLGNTIIVVEHDEETIENADHIVDFGLHAGKKGGKIIFQGSLADIKKDPHSLTGKYLSGRNQIESSVTNEKSDIKNPILKLKGARQFNLKNVTASFPLGQLIAVTGVSGSGKSTLVVETLYPALKQYVENSIKAHPGEYETIDGYQYLDKIYLVDQSSIGRTPRSNPATYIGVFDFIRDVFASTVDAKAKGYKKGRFSFNVKGGRCEKCGGAGTLKIEMQFLPDVYVKCDVCGGRRYNSETLEIRYKDRNIFEVLNMTVDEGAEFFKNYPHIYNKLKTLQDVGLGYLELGQPAPTLSGGEAQRTKLAAELSKKETGRTLYILDEPTTGLHMYDIEKLLYALYRLKEKGNTIVIIEHNLEVIKNCDWIIDLGPEGGDKGGNIVYQGPTDEIKKAKTSYTARYLFKNRGN